MGTDSTIKTDFEQQLSELESLVESMENGDVSLEESIKSFEKGIKLAHSCQKSLKNAELKVKILLSNDRSHDTLDNNTELTDFKE